MAATYDYLPYDMSDIFRSIVAIVNDNLTSDDVLAVNIPRVKFKAETFPELCKRLKDDNDSPDHKEVKYPLIALIRNYESDIKSNDPYIGSSFTFIIVTPTEPTRLSEDRLSTNFRPILYPIYTEFLEQIALSRFFQGPYNPYPTHKMVESFNLGKEGLGGGNAVQIPEYVDAIIISNMRLRVNRPMIAGYQYGPSKQLSYLNNVSKLACQAGSRNLMVNFSQMQYINTAFGAPTPTYSIYFSHDESIDSHIAPGQNYTKTFEAQSGDFMGYIACSDGTTVSMLWFYYSLVTGNVVKYTPSNEFRLESFQLTGFDYPDYPFNVVRQTTCNKSAIQSSSINGNGGNVLEDNFFTPSVNDTAELTTQLSFPALTYYRDIGNQVTIDIANNSTILLESISYYKLS